MPERSESAAPDAARVAATLARIRAGVRQRQAWMATASADGADGAAALLQVQKTQQLEQPIPTSHRGLAGKPIVFAKKVVYHLFMKWYLRSILQQQNEFNRAVSVALQDLYERQQMVADALNDPAAGERADAARPLR